MTGLEMACAACAAGALKYFPWSGPYDVEGGEWHTGTNAVHIVARLQAVTEGEGAE